MWQQTGKFSTETFVAAAIAATPVRASAVDSSFLSGPQGSAVLIPACIQVSSWNRGGSFCSERPRGSNWRELSQVLRTGYG